MRKIDKLREKKIFHIEDAKKAGISPRMLNYYLNQGLIERLSHGVYAHPEGLSFELTSLIEEKLAGLPQAIVGHKTALVLHGLGEEAPTEIHLMVPTSNVPKRKLDNVIFHRVKDSLQKKQVQKIQGLPVTGLERTVVELLRTGESISFVLNILHEIKSHGRPIDLSKLKKLAKEFRVKAKMDQLLEAYY